jgi:hypothetical protein
MRANHSSCQNPDGVLSKRGVDSGSVTTEFTPIAIKVSKENDHGQAAQPSFTHPDGEYLRGC